MPTLCELSLLSRPVAGLGDTQRPLVDGRCSTCCESFDAHTCTDSGRHPCRFIRLYKGDMRAEREGCAPKCREACTCSTRTLSLPSVFRRFGPAEISQPEDLNRRESRGGAYQSSLELCCRILSNSGAAASLSASGPGRFRSAHTRQMIH